MKKIDIHIHIGKLLHSKPGLTVSYVLKFMDELEIEKACVMSIENPEEVDYYVTSKQILSYCRQHPDRLIPFCNVDPRRGNPGTFDPYPIIAHYVDMGCKGLGEMLGGLWIDDPLQMDIFNVCQELKLPVMLHIDKYRNMDEIGLPRLEKVLKTFPDTTFIGHAYHWWSEISADIDDEDRFKYPEGAIQPGGRLDELLQKYSNIYADLSAGSGYNALTRDPAFIKEFLIRNQDKVLFGTDLVYKGHIIQQHTALESLGLPKEVLKKIYYLNAQKFLKV